MLHNYLLGSGSYVSAPGRLQVLRFAREFHLPFHQTESIPRVKKSFHMLDTTPGRPSGRSPRRPSFRKLDKWQGAWRISSLMTNFQLTGRVCKEIIEQAAES